MSQILNITHDAGNINEYTGTVMTSAGDTITATTGSAMMSTPYGLEIYTGTVSAGNLTYAYKNFTSITSTEYRYRGYYDVNSQTGITTTGAYSLIATNTLNSYAELYTVYQSSTFKTQAGVVTDAAGEVVTAFYAHSDAPHYFEVRVKKSSSVSTSDAELELYIDGVSKEKMTGLLIFTKFAVSQMRVGCHYNPISSKTFYFDEIVFRNDGDAIPPTTRRSINITGTI